jgi:RND superfamily putative drug exporter
MTEHDGTDRNRNSGNGPATARPGFQRQAAHERLSTGALARWTRACATHPWRVVFGWVGLVVILVGLVATVGGSLRDEFEIPGSETQKATDLIKSEFASEQGAVLNIVFAAPEGERLNTPERKAAIEKAIALLKSPEFKPKGDKAGVESVGDPFSEDTVSDDGRIAYTEAQFDQTIETEDRDEVVAVEDAVRKTVEPAGVTVEFNGEAEFPPVEQGTSEALGLLAAIIVLLLVFRTFVAMIIPIMLALTALATAFLLLFILAGLTDINTITPILVSMIGLGVGIDYSLFIVTRFRQLLHEGLSPQAAASEAGASAGRAVLFAGLTVAISVSGLAFIGLDFVTKLGIGSALGVLTTVLIANSLLLAVLALLGHKIDRLKVPFLRRVDESDVGRENTLIARWGRFVTAHAKIVFPVVLLVILALASTTTLVRLGAADQGTQPKEQTSRRAYDLLAEGFGPGFNGPIPIVVDVNGDKQAPQKIRDRVQGLPDVASVGKPQFNDERTVAIVFVTPESAPQDEETDKLVDRLRNDVVPAATAGGDAVAYVSGQTAAFKDIADQIIQRMPYFLLYIIGVTLIVLAMAFRSIVVSATAAVTTLLSAFVGFGVLGLVVQEGHLLGLTGLDQTGPITDCLRNPVRALDGLHGLPHEPHQGRARPRPADAGCGRARHLGDRPGGRRRGADHGHCLRSLHPQRRSHPEGIRAAARGSDSHRRAYRADDARARVPYPPGREVVVHPALARPTAPEPHDRVAARARELDHDRRRALRRAGRPALTKSLQAAELDQGPPPGAEATTRAGQAGRRAGIPAPCRGRM